MKQDLLEELQQGGRCRRSRGGGATSGRLSCELWIKIESVVGSSHGWLEGRIDLSAEEFLKTDG